MLSGIIHLRLISAGVPLPLWDAAACDESQQSPDDESQTQGYIHLCCIIMVEFSEENGARLPYLW